MLKKNWRGVGGEGAAPPPHTAFGQNRKNEKIASQCLADLKCGTHCCIQIFWRLELLASISKYGSFVVESAANTGDYARFVVESAAK